MALKKIVAFMKSRLTSHARKPPLGQATIKEMLKVLEKKLENSDFFGELEIVKETTRVNEAPTVKKFEFEGHTVAIKDTRKNVLHGQDYNELRQTFLQHHRAIRDGTIKAEYYMIYTPKVYEIIDNRYLVMQLIKGKTIGEIERSKKGDDRKSFYRAYHEMEENFQILKRKKHIKRHLQSMHVIVQGNTNPKNPKKGKWIFYFVYDYE